MKYRTSIKVIQIYSMDIYADNDTQAREKTIQAYNDPCYPTTLTDEQLGGTCILYKEDHEECYGGYDSEAGCTICECAEECKLFTTTLNKR